MLLKEKNNILNVFNNLTTCWTRLSNYSIKYRNLASNLTALTETDIELVSIDAKMLIMHILQISPTDFSLALAGVQENRYFFSEQQMERLNLCCKRYLQHEPISKIIGHKAFYNNTFFTNEKSLDPRKESECLVDYVLDIINNKKEAFILDMGTGTGCLLISIMENTQCCVHGWGVDISAEALATAQRNSNTIQKTHSKNCVNWLLSSFINTIKHPKIPKNSFDIIVSNPPYIPSSDIDCLAPSIQYDPRIALDGGSDGLMFFRELAFVAPLLLKSCGHLIVEVGASQASLVIDSVASSCHNSQKHISCNFLNVKKDLSNIDRVLDFSFEF